MLDADVDGEQVRVGLGDNDGVSDLRRSGLRSRDGCKNENQKRQSHTAYKWASVHDGNVTTKHRDPVNFAKLLRLLTSQMVVHKRAAVEVNYESSYMCEVRLEESC
jgi:hypothetical protein